MKKRALVVLAEGFEEIEAITPIDVLRRADVDVTVASVGELTVKGAGGVPIQADADLEACADREYDLIVLPGGMPGATNLAASATLAGMLKKAKMSGVVIGAICAAPAVVLHPLGLLGDEKVACYPAFQRRLDEVNRSKERVCLSPRLITAAGPGVAMEFALALTEGLRGKAKAEELALAMLVPGKY